MSNRIWYKRLHPELQDTGYDYCRHRAGFVGTSQHLHDHAARLGQDQAAALAQGAKAAMFGAILGLLAACSADWLERRLGRRRP